MGYGDRLLNCDKTLLNEETRRQQDLFQAGERDPGLMPKPKGSLKKHSRAPAPPLAASSKAPTTFPKLPALGHDSNGNFSVSSGNTTFRSDGHFGVQAPGSKMRFNSDGSFTYNGYNSDGSWNSR